MKNILCFFVCLLSVTNNCNIQIISNNVNESIFSVRECNCYSKCNCECVKMGKYVCSSIHKICYNIFGVFYLLSGCISYANDNSKYLCQQFSQSFKEGRK